MFDDYTYYQDDKRLLEELKLELFTKVPIHTERFLGTVDYHGSTIKVWVQGAPAQFWKFDIVTIEGNHVEEDLGIDLEDWNKMDESAKSDAVFEYVQDQRLFEWGYEEVNS